MHARAADHPAIADALGWMHLRKAWASATSSALQEVFQFSRAPVHARRAGHDACVGQRVAVALLAAGQDHGGVAKRLANHLQQVGGRWVRLSGGNAGQHEEAGWHLLLPAPAAHSMPAEANHCRLLGRPQR